MFFKKGDIIRVKDNGFKAEILDHKDEWNPQIGCVDRTYSVVWQHLQNSGCNAFGDYTHNDVAGEWALVPQITGYTQLNAAGQVPSQKPPTIKEMAQAAEELHKKYDTGFTVIPKEGFCDHAWKTYDSGFTKYDYCENCNEERK